MDGKHTVFGRVCRGMEIVKRLGSVQTDNTDRLQEKTLQEQNNSLSKKVHLNSKISSQQLQFGLKEIEKNSKHTVFGRVCKGMEIVKRLGSVYRQASWTLEPSKLRAKTEVLERNVRTEKKNDAQTNFGGQTESWVLQIPLMEIEVAGEVVDLTDDDDDEDTDDISEFMEKFATIEDEDEEQATMGMISVFIGISLLAPDELKGEKSFFHLDHDQLRSIFHVCGRVVNKRQGPNIGTSEAFLLSEAQTFRVNEYAMVLQTVSLTHERFEDSML
ncbi:peptidyl-prolyl cis-trans isomerase-like protein 1 [Tanacetum coccineum]